MRRILLATTLLLVLAPATALAHNTHGPCTSSRTILDSPTVHVDVYVGNCRGVATYFPIAECAFGDVHVVRGLHTPVLHDGQCETGVIHQVLV
jgi:hypothetical protein